MAISDEKGRVRARRVLARLTFVALLAAFAVTACSLLTSYDGLEGATKGDAALPLVDSNVPDVVVEAAPPADPCASEGVPAPPDAGASASSLGQLVGAAHTIRFIDGDASTIFGLNMDRTCGASCVSSAASPPKDPASGIDNAAFDLFQLMKSLGLKLGDVGFNEALKAGLWGLVVRLDGYSGGPDDDNVQVELLNAADVNKSDGGARFDGTDEWIIDSTSMVAGVSLFRSKVAYVRGNVLVARFERFPLTLRVSGGGSLVLVLSPELFAVTVTAKIVSSADGGLTLADGKLVGAMPPEQFLLQLQRLGVCKTDTIFGTAVDYVCGVRDLATTLTAPATDKCDRISTAIEFDTLPASVSPAVKVVDDVRGCDGGDPTAGCGSR